MFFHKILFDFFTECLRANGTSAIFEYNFVGSEREGNRPRYTDAFLRRMTIH